LFTLQVTTIGKKIADLRKASGMTQQQLADKLSVTNKAISKWETGRGLPDTAILPTLASVLGVSIDDIMSASTITCSNTNVNEIDGAVYRNTWRYKKSLAIVSAVILTFIAGIFIFNIMMHGGEYKMLQMLSEPQTTSLAELIIVTIVLIIFPVLMILSGIYLMKKEYNEINYLFGFRTFRALRSIESFSYANKLYGKLISKAGCIFVVITLANLIALYAFFFMGEKRILALIEYSILMTVIVELVAFVAIAIYVQVKLVKQKID